MAERTAMATHIHTKGGRAAHARPPFYCVNTQKCRRRMSPGICQNAFLCASNVFLLPAKRPFATCQEPPCAVRRILLFFNENTIHRRQKAHSRSQSAALCREKCHFTSTKYHFTVAKCHFCPRKTALYCREVPLTDNRVPSCLFISLYLPPRLTHTVALYHLIAHVGSQHEQARHHDRHAQKVGQGDTVYPCGNVVERLIGE